MTKKQIAKFAGKTVTLYCMNYIYTGTVGAYDEDEVELLNPSIVYDTGELKAKAFANAQELPSTHYVRLSAVESYGAGK